MYSVKEIFYSLQGEGAMAGRPAVFVRFAGCNFWSGREEDRAHAVCKFCDTDFVGVDGTLGGKYPDASSLIGAISGLWSSDAPAYVIFTGGEPLLQLDQALVDAIHARGWLAAVETNGSLSAPEGLDWICMSPKTSDGIVLVEGDELKFVFPQNELQPAQFEHLHFKHFFLQPMDGPFVAQNTELALRYCLENPKWRLSLQTHKMLGIR